MAPSTVQAQLKDSNWQCYKYSYHLNPSIETVVHCFGYGENINVNRDISGECSGDSFLSLYFLPIGNTLTITNESVENLDRPHLLYKEDINKKAKHVDHSLSREN